MYGFILIKRKQKQINLSSQLKETPKQCIEVHYKSFIFAFFRETFSSKIVKFSAILDMIHHDTSQVGSSNSLFLRNND